MIRAGLLDRIVYVVRYSESRNELNEIEKVWVDLHQKRARKFNLKGGVKLVNDVEIPTGTVTFELRYFDDISQKDRIRYDNDLYRIVDIQEVGRRRGLHVFCELLDDGN